MKSIFIMMSYFNRPILVKNALLSILESNQYHTNWHLGFLDDGSKVPGEPIVRDVLKNHLNQVTIVNSNHSFEDKVKNGLILGRLANKAIAESDADLGIMLCDDDELVPDYLHNLSEFYTNNPNVLYAYSKLYLFNPLFPNSKALQNTGGRYNQWSHPLSPVGKVDASQVSWQLDACRKFGAWFADNTRCVEGKPWAKDTDRGFFENLYDKCGPCIPTGFFGQYKGIHDYQLLWHKDANASSLWSYHEMCRSLGGVEF